MELPDVHLILIVLSLAFTDAVVRTLPSYSEVTEISFKTDGMNRLHSVQIRFLDGQPMGTTDTNHLLFQSAPSNEDVFILYHTRTSVSYVIKRKKDSEGTETVFANTIKMDSSVEWHAVSLNFDSIKATLEVDGVMKHSYIKYIPLLTEKVYLYKYQRIAIDKNISQFVGCISNFSLNEVEMQDDLFTTLPEGCEFHSQLLSFSGVGSYLNYTLDDSQYVTKVILSVRLRTFSNSSLLMVLLLDPPEMLQITLSEEKEVHVKSKTNLHKYFTTNKGLKLDDGNYHSIKVSIALSGTLNITVDYTIDLEAEGGTQFLPMPQSRIRSIDIGSSPQSTAIAFTGCISGFDLDDGNSSINLADFSSNNIGWGTCAFQDRCQYGVCGNSQPCRQTETSYMCKCSSQFEGTACVSPRINEESCESPEPMTNNETRQIDPDGSGPLAEFRVACITDEHGEIWTEVQPKEPSGGSLFPSDTAHYVVVQYDVNLVDIRALIDRNKYCRQRISYSCQDSRLLQTKPNSSIPYVYWTGGDGQLHYYWGGTNATTQYRCAEGKICQCDMDHTGMVTDEGYLETKSHLPVTAITYSETKEDGKNKEAMFAVESLMCKTDVIISDDRAVTFTGKGVIEVMVPPGNVPITFSFMFKTTQSNALFVQSERIQDEDVLYFAIGLSNKQNLFVTLMATGIHVENYPIRLTNPINNNAWHSVFFEMTHQAAMISIDLKRFTVWSPDRFRPYIKLYPSSKMYLGGSPNGDMFFSGCIKNLRVAGESIDLHQSISDHGIQTGCVGLCGYSPCLNDGICTEYYSTFSCNCASTGYSNCFCGKDTSINMTQNSSVVYSTGFTNQQPNFRILNLGVRTISSDAALLSFKQTDASKVDLWINSQGKLLGNLTNGGKIFTVLFDEAINDNKSHEISLMARETEGSMNIALKLDETMKTSTNFGQPFTVDGTANFQITLAGQPDSTENILKTFEGCVFSINSLGNTLTSEILNSGTTYGNTSEGDCAPSIIPNNLEQQRVYLDSIFQQSRVISNSRKPPKVEMLTAAPNTFIKKISGGWHIYLVEPITLHCDVSGIPTPRIVWKKDNTPVETSCFHLLKNTSLTILPGETADGLYFCEAVNAWGISRSREHYNVVLPHIKNETKPDLQMGVAEGEPLELSCDEGISSPPSRVIWFKVQDSDDVLLWPGSSPVTQRIHPTKFGHLFFRFVLPEDTGKFFCRRLNPVSGEEYIVQSIVLTVNPPLGPDYKALDPTIFRPTAVPSSYNASLGEDVIFYCYIRDANIPTQSKIVWYHNSERINSTSLTEETLILQNVSTGHAGLYTCKLEDTGQMENITLNIQSPPTFTQSPEFLVTYEGSIAVFTCSVSEENFSLEWFKNWHPLVAGRDRYVFNNDNTFLTISNVSKDEDVQTISCRAFKDDVTLEAEGSLTVVKRLEIVSVPKEVIGEVGTDVVEIAVVILADPILQPSYSWMKDEKPLSSLLLEKDRLDDVLKVFSSDTGSRLQLDLTKLTETERKLFMGHYSCEITDGVGQITAESYIYISKEPDKQLSMGAIIGIVVGCILGFSVIVVLLGYICYSRQKSNRKYGMTVGAYKNPAYSS